jgi:hypothetical protein
VRKPGDRPQAMHSGEEKPTPAQPATPPVAAQPPREESTGTPPAAE